jgi:tetratricopeptide (TPR) repeat protein
VSKTCSTSVARPASAVPARSLPWAVAALLLAVVLAYANGLSGPFVLDDPTSIAENPTIRQLWPPGPVFSPPATAGVGGRPVANLTLALNYALGGENVTGYHVANLLIHALAALALFGLVRRTLLQPVLRDRFGSAATALALAVAALWALHPLQSISVNYVSQRTESLMGLCYFLTLYCLVRSAAPGAGRGWAPLAIAACVLGVASKEVMVTAPVLALLYDRTFLAGSFAAAWRVRGRLYLGLATTWLLLAYLMIGLETRGVGFGAQLPWWTYAAGGCYAMCTYLKLALFPYPLVFDYGPNVLDSISPAPFVAVIAGLALLTLLALRRYPLLGFVGCWFLVILAPTSSIVPIKRQLVAENRAYVPVAAVIAGLVLLAYAKLGRRALYAAAVLALVFGALTHLRNADYRTAVALWGDTVHQRPENWRAHNIYAGALAEAGRLDESIAQFRASLQIAPGLAETHNNFATVLERAGRLPEAVAEYETTLRLENNRPDTHSNFGSLLFRTGHPTEALPHLEEAVRLAPDLVQARNNLANVLAETGRIEEAIGHYEHAIRIAPSAPEAYNNLGLVLTRLRRFPDAIAVLEKVIALRPREAPAYYYLGNAQLGAGDAAKAGMYYEFAVKLDPKSAEAANNLGVILNQIGRRELSRSCFETALRAKPDYTDAQLNLAAVLLDDGLPAEARAHYEAVLRAHPDNPQARDGLARANAAGKNE